MSEFPEARTGGPISGNTPRGNGPGERRQESRQEPVREPRQEPRQDLRSAPRPGGADVVGHGMTYVSETAARSIATRYGHDSGVRELAQAYLELVEEGRRVAALGEEWMGSAATERFGRRLFDVLNDEDDTISSTAASDEDQADVDSARPVLNLVPQVS